MSETPSDTAADLASLLCSRLCHDLLSPVGALSNGLELLAEETDADMRRRCFELLEQSARISIDKLRFFRVAFGAAGSFGDRIPSAEPRMLIEALAANAQRLTVNWTVSLESMSKPAVKTLLNLAMIGMDALVRGGTLDIGAEATGGRCEIVVCAGGGRIAFDPAIGRALEGTSEPAELSSRTAPAAMIRQIAADVGGHIRVALSGEALILGAELPDA